ncbi:MAG: nucleoside-diphosphate kinase [Bacteroidetes bacterium]|nr:nucleoside-diphosphate kinase [Bacteroidota bacterium]
MAGNITFSIIKPDAVANGHAGKILDHIIQAGYKVRALRLIHMTQGMAEGFYAVHRERPFFKDLVSYMCSGPCMPLVLEKADAVAGFRTLIGATDPAKADEGTIRKLYAQSIEANAVHGSDSDENALREARYFFAEIEEVRG